MFYSNSGLCYLLNSTVKCDFPLDALARIFYCLVGSDVLTITETAENLINN